MSSFERSAAKKRGDKRYFNGTSCPKGHISERMTVNGRCCECMRLYKLLPESISRELNRLHLARKNNPEKYRERDKTARARNPERTKEINKKSRLAKKEKNPNKRLYLTKTQSQIANSMRCGVWRSIKKNKAGLKWAQLCGYDLKQLMQHLERQFTKGMSWENYGEWEIDHIIPICSFTFDSPNHPDFKVCYALSNLRPLWKEKNREKWFRRTHLV